jgi:hypothetical protein
LREVRPAHELPRGSVEGCAVRSIWDETRPPACEGVSPDHIATFKNACAEIPTRGLLALMDAHVIRFWHGTTDVGETFALHLLCATADRLTGEPTRLAFAAEITADQIANYGLPLEHLIRNELRFMFDHEVDESLWDGRPETDPHRFDDRR